MSQFDQKRRIELPNGETKFISGILEELHIELVEATELLRTNEKEYVGNFESKTSCGVYVKIRFGREERQTRTVRVTSPKFEEKFVFIISDPTNLREEVLRLMSDLSTLHLDLFEQDEDGSSRFVGHQMLTLTTLLRTERPLPCVAFTLDLLDDSGSFIPGDGPAGRGQIKVQAAIRQGKQCEVLRRIQGSKWLGDALILQALHSIPSLFSVGDQEVVSSVVRLLNSRHLDPVNLIPEHSRLIKEIGIPLGITSAVLDRESCSSIGPRLAGMIRQGVPILAAVRDDPRDIRFQTMNTHWRARFLAMHALSSVAMRGDESCIAVGLDLLCDGCNDVRASAVVALSHLAVHGDSRIVDSLVKCLADESNYVRDMTVAALRSVSRINDGRTIISICAHLDDERVEVRNSAISALKLICTRGFCTALVETSARLESPSCGVRASAVEAISLIAGKGDQGAIVEILNRIQHPSESVRLCALQALNACAIKGDRFVIAGLANLLDHPDWSVRQMAIGALQVHASAGDVAAIHVVAARITTDVDSISVIEGAKFVAMPTNAEGLAVYSDSANPLLCDFQASPPWYTPRLPCMMPLKQTLHVALKVPLLPADKNAPSIAFMWWNSKHASDTLRHRYDTSYLCSRNQGFKSFQSEMQDESLDWMLNKTIDPLESHRLVHTARWIVLNSCEQLLKITKNGTINTKSDAEAFSNALKLVLKQDPVLSQSWNYKRLFPVNLESAMKEPIDFKLAHRIIHLHKRERVKLESVLEHIRTKLGMDLKLEKNTKFYETMLSNPETEISDSLALNGTLQPQTSSGKSTYVGSFSVTVINARNLPSISTFGGCDPYVQIELDSKEAPRFRSSIKLHSRNPEWMERFSMNIENKHLETNFHPKKSTDMESPPVPADVESKIGLFIDLKVCIPLASKEWNGSKKMLLMKTIADIASVDQNNVYFLVENQISSREISLITRIVTSSLFRTLKILCSVSERDFGVQIEAAGFFDQRHLLEVSVDYLMSADDLMICSTTLTVSIWNFSLGSNDFLLGMVTLPLAPLVFSCIASDKEIDLSFELSEAGARRLVFDLIEEDSCQLRLSFKFEPNVGLTSGSHTQFYHTEPSHRVKLLLSQEIRNCAVEALSMLCGDSFDITASEILKAFEKNSPRVHESAIFAVRSIANAGHSMCVTNVLLAADKGWVVTSSLDGTIKIWSINSAKVVHTLRCHYGPVNTISLHPNRNTLLISIGSDGIICFNDISNFERIYTAKICQFETKIVKISSDGNRLLIFERFDTSGHKSFSSGNKVSVWNLTLPQSS